ncbi:GNAT family N-acetyltransferase [Arthrobacter sp. zg-Y1110]|uniref:GNAT family N-acetyltransferase n=1 Tax=Arthrobacter sp. zg-Y1110 TaxID=2886932 RepID=UPI001D15E055|nr:GNAT family N-acetyltransferase [Arthrobacter sp. zg-Y1110]MCC3292498.1 GNAT family N-acetyltransferase [Arthrobacter sp. zg-Y1110]UWX87070.1 GNAT family N-acetyltransferase [Arthrobacter sp. zg-Y1110]
MRAETLSINVAPFRDEHIRPAAEALLRVRIADPTYPPPRDTPATVPAFEDWLMAEQTLGRWVAEVDGLTAGHISLTRAHRYLTDALAILGFASTSANGYCEISKFFTDPLHQGHGVGAELFEEALAAGRSSGYQPALAVIDTSYAARRFYAARGMREAGSFSGVHGINHVFVDEG